MGALRAFSLIALLTVAVSQDCPAGNDLFINTGGKNLAGAIRCDTGAYANSGSWNFEIPQQNIGPGCNGYYFSHRVVSAGNLVYNIPVNQGTYTVKLFFAEIWYNAAGLRTFSVNVNGKTPAGVGIMVNGANVDVFQAVGKNKPLQLSTTAAASGGTITITIGRKIGNPMLSAISIKGAGATAKVGGTGLGSCTAGVGTGGGGTTGGSTGGGTTGGSTGGGSTGGGGTSSTDGAGVLTGVQLPCPTTNGIFINAGGKNTGNGYRCDTGGFGTALKYEIPAAVNLGGCSSSMWSHGYTDGLSLDYSISVPVGTYKVQLLFMETFWTAANKRKFTVSVNGKTPAGVGASLDVFAAAKGKNIPYSVTATVTATNSIDIKLGKVGTFDNPFISAIAITSSTAAANTVIGTEGLNACTPAGTFSGNGGVSPGGGGACATDFTPGAHLAHSVSGGPYVEVDFNKQGFANVALDGTGSHSHASTATASGTITKYTWSWVDKNNPSANAQGIVTANGASPKPPFPIGTTAVTLEVVDQFSNCAAETTQVTVNPPTKPGPFCYVYNYGSSAPTQIPLPLNLAIGYKPQHAFNPGNINIGGEAGLLGSFNFKSNSLAVRCVYQIDVPAAGTYTYSVVHNGPLQVYQGSDSMATSNGFTGVKTTTTKPKFFAKGLHSWQILYFRKQFQAPTLKLQFGNGALIPPNVLGYDASVTLPVIKGISVSSGFAGQVVTVTGLSFVNNAKVLIGGKTAIPVSTKATSYEVAIPSGTGKVNIVVSTEAGTSNPFEFTYSPTTGVGTPFCIAPKFTATSLKNADGAGSYSLPGIAVIKYGPDGRLYAGTQFNMIHALTINKNLAVTKLCSKNVKGSYPRRWVLGIAFNPADKALKMWYSTSTMFWNNAQYEIKPYSNGWTNGKVEVVTINGPNGCFGASSDVVTGLPVSNHDHGINFLQFLPSGQLLISVAGTANGGISVPDDNLGGIPESPLSGAIVSCPAYTETSITYTEPFNPAGTGVNSGGCKIYASGLRNSFGAYYHSNKNLYAMDNGPNQGFGSFSTNCNGGQVPAYNTPDRLMKIQPGQCHGHPNLNRGKAFDFKQCVFRHPNCVKQQPVTFKSSTNGVLEYRSNLFNGLYKSTLFLSRFSGSPNVKGSTAHVVLNGAGNIQQTGSGSYSVTQNFFQDSGLSIAEGPRGEVIMSRVFKSTFLVYQPVCSGSASSPYLIGVHPKRGPAAGGQQVLISGFKFGTNPTVMFGSKPCLAPLVLSNQEQIICTTPSGAKNSQVTVKVISGGISSPPSKGSDFWYW